MSLDITTPPTAEPITLDDVKLRLRITSDTDDALIMSLLTPARSLAEKFSKKSLVSKGYTLRLERFPWPNEPIRLPIGPVSAVGDITYLDIAGTQQVWSSDEYLIGLAQLPAVVLPMPGTIYPATYAAPGLNTVTVPFTAGPGDGALNLPLDEVLEGARQLAAHLYEHPEAVTSENLKEMPLGIQVLLGANRTYSF